MNISKYKVPVNKLRWSCDPKQFDFTATKDMLPLEGFIGQDRAVQALEFGLEMNRAGYNIYVAGLTGTGKVAMTKSYIEKVIKSKEAAGTVTRPDDWCYLYNFTEPDRPQVISLPQGEGRAFRKRILKLMNRGHTIEDYKKAIFALKMEFPALRIRTNILVGFPGETESDFQETIQLINELDYLLKVIH